MKKGFIVSMIVVLGMVLLIGTSNAAIVSFEGMPNTVGWGQPIKFEVWLNGLEQQLSDIATFGLWIGVTPPGGSWDTDYIKSTTLANSKYVFYENSGAFDATIQEGGGIYITDVYNVAPASTHVPVKLASLKLDQFFPVDTWITFSVVDSDWSYVQDSNLTQDSFQPIEGSVQVATPIPNTALLLGSGLIGLLGLVKRRLRK